MTADEALRCAVCGSQWGSMKARAAHEGGAHPEWSAPSELRRARRNFKNRRWKVGQGPSYLWIDHANTTASKYGQPPLALKTQLPTGPCAYCGGVADGWDHIVPFARGGSHTLDNLTPCCLHCNQVKGVRPAEVVREPVAVTTGEPIGMGL